MRYKFMHCIKIMSCLRKSCSDLFIISDGMPEERDEETIICNYFFVIFLSIIIWFFNIRVKFIIRNETTVVLHYKELTLNAMRL